MIGEENAVSLVAKAPLAATGRSRLMVLSVGIINPRLFVFIASFLPSLLFSVNSI